MLGTLEGIQTAEANITTLDDDKRIAQAIARSTSGKFNFRLAIVGGCAVLSSLEHLQLFQNMDC